MKHLLRSFLLIFLMSLCAAASAAPQRIISLTPVGTEILFDLGQGDKIAGVTYFCDYPPEALKKPKIGGYSEVNFETRLMQNADLIVLQDMHRQFCADLDRLKIPYLIVKQESINDIYEALAALGKVCGAEKKAAEITAQMKREIEAVEKKVKGLPAPSVLLCVSRELTEKSISIFYAAGERTFYNEIIERVSGKNALKGKTNAAYPKISQEGLIDLDPEVIIDLVGERSFYHSMENVDLDKVFKKDYLTGQWMTCASVNAVRNKRVTVLDGTVYLRPGPRLPVIMKAFAEALHPEIKW